MHVGVTDENRGVVGFGLDQGHAKSVEIVRNENVEVGFYKRFLDSFKRDVAVEFNREMMTPSKAFGTEKIATAAIDVESEVGISLGE